MLISIKTILTKSIHLYRDNAKLFLSYMGVLFVPLAISIILGGLFSLGEPTSLILALLSLIIMIVVYLCSLLITLAITRVIAHRYNGIPAAPIKEELKKSLPLLWPSILASLLGGLIILGGMFLLIIPGIIFSIWYAFVVYAVAIDNQRPIEALRASKSLVVGRWWAVCIKFIVPGIIFGILTLIVESIIGKILSSLGQGISPEQTALYIGVSILFGLISSVVSLLLTPLTMTAPVILYEELKKVPVSAKK